MSEWTLYVHLSTDEKRQDFLKERGVKMLDDQYFKDMGSRVLSGLNIRDHGNNTPIDHLSLNGHRRTVLCIALYGEISAKDDNGPLSLQPPGAGVSRDRFSETAPRQGQGANRLAGLRAVAV